MHRLILITADDGVGGGIKGCLCSAMAQRTRWIEGWVESVRTGGMLSPQGKSWIIIGYFTEFWFVSGAYTGPVKMEWAWQSSGGFDKPIVSFNTQAETGSIPPGAPFVNLSWNWDYDNLNIHSRVNAHYV